MFTSMYKHNKSGALTYMCVPTEVNILTCRGVYSSTFLFQNIVFVLNLICNCSNTSNIGDRLPYIISVICLRVLCIYIFSHINHICLNVHL